MSAVPALVFGGLALLVGLLIVRTFANANPTSLAHQLKAAGGVAAIALGGLMLLSGRGIGGVPLIAVGIGLLVSAIDRSRRRPAASSASMSTVRTRFLMMQFDRRSGAVTGAVLAGRFAGRRLDDLGAVELGQLRSELDADSLALLEPYLQRRGAGGTADREGDANGSHSRRSGEMSQEEAYQVLGLQPGAGADEVRRAHRSLMMKLHPDQGGSTYLAARVNEAKEVLLRRHG